MAIQPVSNEQKLNFRTNCLNFYAIILSYSGEPTECSEFDHAL